MEAVDSSSEEEEEERSKLDLLDRHTLVSGYDCVEDLTVWSADRCMMCFNMNVSWLLPGFLLLLVSCLCDRSVGEETQKTLASPEDRGAHFRDLWKIHMRDSVLKGKGEREPEFLTNVLFHFFCFKLPESQLSSVTKQHNFQYT